MTSNPRLLLDTHVWVNYQTSVRAIRPEAAAAIEAAAIRNELYVSVISIWELAMLERDRRLDLHGGVHHWTQEALTKPGVHLLGLSPAIAIETVYLSEPMHKDPADRILVASARMERMTLVTSDKAILAFAKQSGLPYVRA